MSHKSPLVLVVFILLGSTAFSQSVIGQWKTIDDNTGREKSIVEFFEKDAKVHAKIIKLFREPGEDPDPICSKCDEDDSRHGQKVIGMVIVRNMVKDGQELVDGDILDPQVGKVYRCKLWLEGGNLMVRGYWGPFYRTQVWKRAE